jgi:hypothetical protein
VIINDRKFSFTSRCSSTFSSRLTIKLLALKSNSLFRLLSVALMPNGAVGLVERKRKRNLNVDSCITDLVETDRLMPGLAHTYEISCFYAQ